MFDRKSWLCACAALAIPALAAAGDRTSLVAASAGADQRAWSVRVDQLLAAGDLAIRLTRDDTMIPGRRVERLAQVHRGVPVFGGELVRQADAASTLSVFGTLYEGVEVDVAPRLGPAEVRARIAERGGRPFGPRGGPELGVLPLADGGYRLAWRVRAYFEKTMDIRQVFLDAATGAMLREYSDIRTQAAGIGTGVLGDKEKLSVSTGGAGYTTADRLRPPVISTYDFRFDVNRLILFLNADAAPSNLTAADLGTDADNVWTDGALVDAHVYAGFTYDYYYKRFGRRGLDNNNVAIHSVTHALDRDTWREWSVDTILSWFTNAMYFGDGVMYYGDGLPGNVTLYGQHVNYMAAGLDIVAHELTHGVTQYTSNLEYHDEPGALDEAFSDIMATGAEFYFQPEKADYLAGEDVFTPGGDRNLQNPMSYGYPDHYSVRYLGSQDNGGVHINSTIVSHAFYLAIEGGRHRLGGTVQGVGAANRDQIEKVFYRGFTMYLTPTSTFSQARAATIQAARDLYDPGSAAETAVIQAWNAVGVH